MPVVWSPLALVGALLTLSNNVMQLAESAKAKRYRKNCHLLQDRVRLIANHLRELQQGTSESDPSPATQDTMKCLEDVLRRAQELVQSCQRKKRAFDFLRAHKKTGEFAFVGKRISNIMESFHMANRSLIQGLYSDRIFMVLLKTLLQDHDGIRVLQNNRRRLEIAVSGLTYSNNNMSPEKKEILNFVEEALGPGWRQRYAAKPASYNEGVQQVANIAKDIVLKVEAESHSKAEVERVAQLARQVLYFLPHLQTPQLAQHPETPGLLHSLWVDLEAAHETIVFGGGGGPLQCGGRGAAVMTGSLSFSSEHAKKICRIGNSVERVYQSLTFIAMHQILQNNAC
ncbi:hypothetical protein BDA96_09G267200 [Sorghum bicolor]|nr:uncharacterized protein LOC8065307 [Sorghum bicolor]EES18789.1 hypothetical protein SORBI_3009G252100 [Sorghum bicolor]KAG0519471.1 hypothetical protein BDA96_09G267200 [Sorghum bicolor]|eukprot:XP_002440359.1 uncharacterized protein LOC8065307 [Sorghum bicolor]